MRLFRVILLSLLVSSLVLLPIAHAAELALPSGDLTAPVIKHTPIRKDVPPGQPVDIKAMVTDNVGVKEVILFYRESSSANFKRLKMNRDLDSFIYTVNIPVVDSPGLEYYIQATDLAGNTLLFGHAFSPLTITVALAAADKGETKAIAAMETQITPVEKEEKSGVSKWVWIGLGVVAVGAALAAGGRGRDDEKPPPTTGTIIINGPAP
ncbi:hypothetical protein MNBD_GAMMA20-751 [hydrothermal vent metagenome]|uniref:Uncharacterized protein n=1 Tax=hydrothermal vent metagenome TaxID=652676 RepID=A0A3B1AHV4_9ZZZZ